MNRTKKILSRFVPTTITVKTSKQQLCCMCKHTRGNFKDSHGSYNSFEQLGVLVQHYTAHTSGHRCQLEQLPCLEQLGRAPGLLDSRDEFRITKNSCVLWKFCPKKYLSRTSLILKKNKVKALKLSRFWKNQFKLVWKDLLHISSLQGSCFFYLLSSFAV